MKGCAWLTSRDSKPKKYFCQVKFFTWKIAKRYAKMLVPNYENLWGGIWTSTLHVQTKSCPHSGIPIFTILEENCAVNIHMRLVQEKVCSKLLLKKPTVGFCSSINEVNIPVFFNIPCGQVKSNAEIAQKTSPNWQKKQKIITFSLEITISPSFLDFLHLQHGMIQDKIYTLHGIIQDKIHMTKKPAASSAWIWVLYRSSHPWNVQNCRKGDLWAVPDCGK